MPFIAAAGAAAATFAGGAAVAVGATTAASAIAAAASSIVMGAITGAMIGAATALVTGQNVFKGALKGAALGGISSGIISVVGMATGVLSSTEQLAKVGVDSSSFGKPDVPQATPTAPNTSVSGSENSASGAIQKTADVANKAEQTGLLSKTVESGKDVIKSAKESKFWSGIGEGLARGVGDVGAAIMSSDSSKDLAKWQDERDRARIANNIPGTFQAQTVNAKIPNWWNKYLNADLQMDPVKPTMKPLMGATA